MNNAVVKLEQFFLTNLEIRVPLPSEKVEKRPTDVDISARVFTKKDVPNIYKLVFRVECPSFFEDGYPPNPEINAEIIGTFSCPDEMEEKDRAPRVRYNGAMILYGILRGQIASITGTFPGGAVTLPSLNMLEKLKEIDTKANKQIASDDPKPKALKKASVKKGAKKKSKKTIQ